MSAFVASRRRVRPVRYKRVCQHCQQEILTARSYFNFWYSLLCRSCFRSNAAPVSVHEG